MSGISVLYPAPAVHETLTPDDTVDLLEELLPAQNKSYELGLKFKLPQSEVESIHSTYFKPRNRLLHTLIEFTNQAEPRPTWMVIVEALRSPAVNLPALARRVESAHFPDSTSTDTESATETTADDEEVKSKPPSLPISTESETTGTDSVADDAVYDEVKPKPSSMDPVTSSSTVEAVEAEIDGFHQRFNSIKELTIRGLQKCYVTVLTVVYILTNIRTVKEHMFLKENHKALRQCEDHLELFGSLNFYWSYLACDLLDHLIRELAKKHKFFSTVAGEMALYKKDLLEFRKRTTLELFCKAEPNTEEDPPPGFRKLVVKFDWPETATLEDVEKFRRQYASSYNLQTCAMMLNSIGTGSFTVTWFVPASVVEILRKKRALAVFKEFNVTRLEIHTSTQVCVYQTPPRKATTENESTPTSIERRLAPQRSEVEEDYPFVEQPSDDFFCPVTFGLLLQPHLTSCCGNHLSQEAVTRVQGEGGACPLCKASQWSTVLNKHFQRQVNSLCVFCRHEDKGCGWQGELAAFTHHVQSCPMTGGPLMTELVKMPVYNDGAAATEDSSDRTDPVVEKEIKGHQETYPSVPKGSIVIALFDWKPREKWDLAFQKGEKLEIIDSESKDGQWWLARKGTKQGFIPSNYVAEYRFFYGLLSAADAEMLLRAHCPQGTFLIREDFSTKLSLSIVDNQTVRHYPVICAKDTSFFFITGHKAAFQTVQELVDHYSKDSDGLCTMLTTPCPTPEKPPIDKWEISRTSITLMGKLGQAQFGEVFRGVLNGVTPVVIKTPRPGTKWPSTFYQEIDITKQISHPKLIRLHAVCTQDEPLLIINEFLSQTNMVTYLQGEGQNLKIPQLVDMAAQVAAGMAYLELKNIVHRDLAAKNIMVGENNSCKIANFGLAKFSFSTEYDGPEIPLRWLAPEVLYYGKFSTQSDVWSFGILLTELVTHGQIPYRGMTNDEVQENLIKGYRMPCPPNTPELLYKLMLYTWEENPESRPTFGNLLQILEKSDFT